MSIERTGMPNLKPQKFGGLHEAVGFLDNMINSPMLVTDYISAFLNIPLWVENKIQSAYSPQFHCSLHMSDSLYKSSYIICRYTKLKTIAIVKNRQNFCSFERP